ncbi:MAG: hypothetical protein IPP90_03270 [Gemmatimonadaceae bacterium]|nr:hypothetical protein [Gemmatimonadaceae bacterium]
MQKANQHLDLERCAAFDHDALTTDELAHLAGCTVCRAERQAYVALQVMAAGMATSSDGPRLTEWERLASGLRAEGLLASPAPMPSAAVASASLTLQTAPPPLRAVTPPWLRVAAALVFTAGGALLGRLSTGAGLLPTASSIGAVPTSADGTGGFSSVPQASDVLYRAQRDYERASLWLAANDTTVHSSDVYRARLAALDQMMTASRAALREAPQDPVLNHYFLAAYTAREATLQALGGALPVDKSLERY